MSATQPAEAREVVVRDVRDVRDVRVVRVVRVVVVVSVVRGVRGVRGVLEAHLAPVMLERSQAQSHRSS